MSTPPFFYFDNHFNSLFCGPEWKSRELGYVYPCGARAMFRPFCAFQQQRNLKKHVIVSTHIARFSTLLYWFSATFFFRRHDGHCSHFVLTMILISWQMSMTATGWVLPQYFTCSFYLTLFLQWYAMSGASLQNSSTVGSIAWRNGRRPFLHAMDLTALRHVM